MRFEISIILWLLQSLCYVHYTAAGVIPQSYTKGSLTKRSASSVIASLQDVDHRIQVLEEKVNEYKGGFIGFWRFTLVPVKKSQGELKKAIEHCLVDIEHFITMDGNITRAEVATILGIVNDMIVHTKDALSMYVLREQDFGIWRPWERSNLETMYQHFETFTDALIEASPAGYEEPARENKKSIEALFKKVLDFYSNGSK